MKNFSSFSPVCVIFIHLDLSQLYVYFYFKKSINNLETIYLETDEYFNLLKTFPWLIL
jgi:hypothetical protein